MDIQDILSSMKEGGGGLPGDLGSKPLGA